MIYLSSVPRPNGFIYLASPYHETDIVQKQIHYVVASAACCYIVKQGFSIYNPIVHWHDISLTWNTPLDLTHWNIFNKPFMDSCAEMWILMAGGWQESEAIKEETEYMRALEKPVRFVLIGNNDNDILMLEEEN